jgi:hypothetical protein
MAEEISKDVTLEEPLTPFGVEKKHHHQEINEMTADGGYLVDRQLRKDESSDSSVKEIKTTKDGKTALIPQPSDDPRDPLNWSWGKKHSVLVALTFSALCMFYISLLYRNIV